MGGAKFRIVKQVGGEMYAAGRKAKGSKGKEEDDSSFPFEPFACALFCFK